MIAAQSAAVPVAWLVARAAGLVALALLTISVTLGLTLSTKLLGGRRGKMLLGWHQTIMWTAVAMLGLHGAALAVDPVMRFGLVGVLVPGVAPWRPVPVAAGIVTGWLMLTLALSFRVRRRIGRAVGACFTTEASSALRWASTTRSTSAPTSPERVDWSSSGSRQLPWSGSPTRAF